VKSPSYLLLKNQNSISLRAGSTLCGSPLLKHNPSPSTLCDQQGRILAGIRRMAKPISPNSSYRNNALKIQTGISPKSVANPKKRYLITRMQKINVIRSYHVGAS
ncbi:hypothetical protein GIB67_016797, partial [Kingdonia uniflora]